ncbi:MAG: hypothetical protein BGO41_09930 [Clostridiales bacterium 38-18]|nr:MAG: hypothetical protein BGO41_09930 [Clostridiales bacterium 38-18]
MSIDLKKLEKLNTADLQVIDRLIAMPTILANKNKVAYINPQFYSLFGYDLQTLNERGLDQFIHPIHRDGYEQLCHRALVGDAFNEQSELCVLPACGSEFWVEHKTRIVNFEGEPFLLSHLMDISEKKKGERHLSKLLKLRESMLGITQSVVRAEGVIQIYKDVLKSVVSCIDNAKLGTVMLRDGDYLKPVAQIGFDNSMMTNFKLKTEDLFLYRETKGRLDEIVIINDLSKYGDYYGFKTDEGFEAHIKSTLSAPIYINGRFFGAVNVDSTETDAFVSDDIKLMTFIKSNVEIALSNQLLYEEKAFLSRYDALTSLYNRHYFDNMFEHVIDKSNRYGEKFNLVVFDINDLKQINDEHGHIAGDELLKYFSQSSRSLIRKSDLLARYGGDEFVGIFYNCSREKLRKKIDTHLKSLMEQPYSFGGKPFVCSYSYGISTYGEDGTTLSELFRVADDRMYQNKIRYKLGFDFLDAFDTSGYSVKSIG